MSEIYRHVVSPRRSRIAFQIAPDGVLEVRTPPGVDEKTIGILLCRYRGIVEKLKSRARLTAPPELEDGALCFYRGREYPVRPTHRLALFDHAFLLPSGNRETRRFLLEKIYRAAAAAYILPRAELLAAKHHVAVKSFSISGAAHRYGSCSATGKCAFSWRLIQFPDEMIDYVICHELSHRLEMNHSPAFYAVLEKFFPGAGDMRRQMEEFSRSCKLF